MRTVAAWVVVAWTAAAWVVVAWTAAAWGQERARPAPADVEALRRARGACRGDAPCEGRVGVALADAHRAAGRRREAIEELTRAIPRLGADVPARSKALEAMAGLHLESGDRRRAVAALDEAAAGYRRAGDRRGEARVLLAKGIALGELGERGPAITALMQARAISVQLGDRAGKARAEQRIAMLQPTVQLSPGPPPPREADEEPPKGDAGPGKKRARPPDPDGGPVAGNGPPWPESGGGPRAAPPDMMPPPPPGSGGGSRPVPANGGSRNGETVTLERYPNVLAASRAEVDRELPVIVSLSDVQETRDVEVVEGEGAAPGTVVLRLPATKKEWPVTVALIAPDVDVVSDAVMTVTVPRQGSSTRAIFKIHTRRAGRFSLWVMFSAESGYIGKVVKWLEVVPAGTLSGEGLATASGAPASTASTASPAGVAAPTLAVGKRLRASTRTPMNDLEVVLRYSDETVRKPGQGDRLYRVVSATVESPRYGKGGPQGRVEVIPADLKEFLEAAYRRIMARAGRGFSVAGDAPPGRAATIDEARGLGRALWAEHVPESVKSAITEVYALARRRNPDRPFRVQIYSNDPLLPWELVSFQDGGQAWHDFLGTETVLARAYETDELSLDPEPVLTLSELDRFAPAYGPPTRWPYLDAAGETPEAVVTQAVAGTRDALRRTMQGSAPILLHFAGHGVIVARPGGDMEFALVLEGDDRLTATQWAALFKRRDRPFFAFINACEQGQLEQAGGRIEGWAPAMVASGAAGYIGALWPIRNDGAREFARQFYLAALGGESRPTVPEALAAVRARFFATGDPTYLAYVYYGYASLRLDVPRAP